MKLTDFDAVLFDMDGTLYHEDHPLPGAIAMLSQLVARGIPFTCLTNAAWRTPAELIARMTRMGIPLARSQIYTAGEALVDWIAAQPPVARPLDDDPKPRVFNFAGKAVGSLLAGRVRFVERGDEPCDVVAVSGHMRADGVAFDMDRALIAMNHLRAGAKLAVSCADRVYPVEGGLIFGSGAWGELFRYGANVPADRVFHAGKPGRAFFMSVCDRLGVAPSRCLLFGDNLESDIRGGLTVGATTALLLSDVTTREHLASSDIQPHMVFTNLTEALDTLG